MPVLNTASPAVVPAAPSDRPRYTDPSAKAMRPRLMLTPREARGRVGQRPGQTSDAGSGPGAGNVRQSACQRIVATVSSQRPGASAQVVGRPCQVVARSAGGRPSGKGLVENSM